ncbi:MULTISPECIES: AEC family transporter [Marinobacterium]|jgi:predicted permease|uniref:AEC family transporter n=1 Tax=Marinobacterium TaxID=48075 RepID=UPI001A8DD23C|nr:AEC family transporter [Marinobacterium iners]QSR35940.1 transporter [Marinobacterium iners]
MTDVLSITAPIFIIIGFGYLAVKSGLMPREAMPLLGRFVLYFTLPALIFGTLSQMQVSEVIQFDFLTIYAIGSLGALLGGIALNRLIFNTDLAEASVRGMGMSASNSAFIGYPVLLQVFGSAPTQPFTMALLVENILILPLALILIEYGKRDTGTGEPLLQVWRRIFMRILRSPLIIAILAGLICASLQLSIPSALDRSLEMLAMASVGTALFVIGGSLVGTRVNDSLGSISLVAAGKLLLHPLLMLLLVMLWRDFDPQLEKAVILAAAMPMLSVFPIIGGNYGYGRQCAGMLLVTTALSFITLTLILALMG